MRKLYVKRSSPEHPCVLCGKPGEERTIYFSEGYAEIARDVDLCGVHYGAYMGHGIGRLYGVVMAGEASRR